MKVSQQKLQAESASTGFRPEILEKVIYILNLLEGFRSHPFLKGKLALKGGTALNLFMSDVPRLSVDIDLNYIGAADLEAMKEDRPKVEDAIRAVCTREGMNVTREPSDHAGGKWRLKYDSADGGRGNLEVDLNFMFRVPLWAVQTADSRLVGTSRALQIPLMDIHELAAGKLAALLARQASRDLFDSHLLLSQRQFDINRLRLAFVVYGGMNRVDWRTVRPEDIDFDARELRDQLLPTVKRNFLDEIGDANNWAAALVSSCRTGLACVLPFNHAEKEFLDRLLDHGEIVPSLLTKDTELADRISRQPLLQWKAQNVRQHKGGL